MTRKNTRYYLDPATGALLARVDAHPALESLAVCGHAPP
jgi:hypothetical protein